MVLAEHKRKPVLYCRMQTRCGSHIGAQVVAYHALSAGKSIISRVISWCTTGVTQGRNLMAVPTARIALLRILMLEVI